MNPRNLSLDEWIEHQARLSATHMAEAISATDRVCRRTGFGQTIRPAPGSVLASPETDLESGPDYFFHWFRDAAVVMDAAVTLAAGPDGAAWIERIDEWLDFSLRLDRVDGPATLRAGDFHAGVQEPMRRFVRPDEEIAAISRDRVLDDVRVNADGTLDRIRWSRPQFDGAAAEAVTVMRLLAADLGADKTFREMAEAVLRPCLDYTLARLDAPCFDVWEEECGEHYYTRLVQHTALERGAAWAAAHGDADAAERYAAGAARLAPRLDAFWSEADGFYRSRMPGDTTTASKALDFSVIFAALHTRRYGKRHGLADPRMVRTFSALERFFAADYPLNHGRDAPFAFGRFPGDVYCSGGAYFFSSFGAAEFHYRRGDVARGDAILSGLRDVIPESGHLSEQFDKGTGVPTSARNLAWSYAAFLTAREARISALGQTPG